MRFQTDLVPARLIRRYKRFLADARLPDGREVTAHCPNPGAMTGLAEPGMNVWLEPNDDQKKKLNFGWRLVEIGDGGFACVDTATANRIVGEALNAHHITELGEYDTVQAEVKYGDSSRVDFLLSGPHGKTFLEVKSVTLSRKSGLAEFPDTVTKRGTKHLGELAKQAQSGAHAVVLYLIQRSDCTVVSVAVDIDPDYANAERSARAAGVEFLTYRTVISTETITIGDPAEIHPL